VPTFGVAIFQSISKNIINIKNINIVVVGLQDVGKSSILASLFETRDILLAKTTEYLRPSKGFALTATDLPGTNNSAVIFDDLGYDSNAEKVSEFIQTKIKQSRENDDDVGEEEWEQEQKVWNAIINADICLYVIDMAREVKSHRKMVRAHFQQINTAKVPILTLLNKPNILDYRKQWLEVLKTAGEHSPIDCDAFVHSRDDTVRVFEGIERTLDPLLTKSIELRGIREEISEQSQKGCDYRKEIIDSIARFIINAKRNSFSTRVPKWANEDDPAFSDLLVYANRSYDDYLNKFIESLAKCCGNFENTDPPVDLKFKYTKKDFNKDAIPFTAEYIPWIKEQTIALIPKDELLIRFAERLLEFGVKVYRRGYATKTDLPILGKQALKDKEIKKKLKAAIIKYSNAEPYRNNYLNDDDEDSTPSYEEWAILNQKRARRVLASDIHALFVHYLELNTPKVYSEPD
jgi:hypothetical protein